jgi:hypothetical protein
MRRDFAVRWPLALALVVAGCGGDPELTRERAGSVVVVFRPGDGSPAWGEVPFPSDLYRQSAGGVGAVPGVTRLASSGTASIDEGLRSLDGFGRSTGVSFCLQGEPDPSSLEPTDGVTPGIWVVDVDPASPGRGTKIPASARFYPSLGCVGILPLPGRVLRPGTRYAAIVTRAVRGSDGLPLGADEELVRIRALAQSARGTAAESIYGDALDALVELHVVPSKKEISGIAVFTTSRMAEELAELAERLRAQKDAPVLAIEPESAAPYTAIVFGSQSTPSLDDWLGIPEKDENGREWPGGDNPTGIAHDAIGAIGSGAFTVQSFRDPKSGRFERNPDGSIQLADAAEKIPVTIVIPKAPPPASGYPVIVNGHGLSNNRGSMLAVANEFARAGFVTIGIDDVLHGARAGIADKKNNAPGSYQGPDGIPDEMPFPLAFFAGLSDFVAIRDSLRQTVLDQVSLVRLVQSPALDLSALGAAAGAPPPKLDPTRIHYNGGSLGGIIGSMLVAVEPSIHAAALEVPGGGFAHLVTTGSAKMSGIVSTLIRGSFGVVGEERLDEHHPLVNLLAQTMEAGDPLAYAPHVFVDRLLPASGAPNVLVTYAKGDEVLPNIATFALLRAFGMPVAGIRLEEQPGIERVGAPLSGNFGAVTGGATEYAPANHALGYMRWDRREFLPGVPLPDAEQPFPQLGRSFQIEMPIREHSDQIVHFFTSSAAGAAEIIVTAPPIADYDGDGVLDEDELAAGTDPLDPESH